MSYVDKIIDKEKKAKATRKAFGERLVELGEENPRIVALDADLSKSTGTLGFSEKFPERFFNLGIAEANMIGVAAGLANSGYIPFAASFAAFVTGRFDTIRMSVSFSETNVRLVGTHAGVGIGEDGHSQMGLEDLALMRVLPNMTVFQPGDEEDTRRFMDWSIEHKGPCYLRLTRQNLPALKRASAAPFKPGKWELLSAFEEGTEVVLLGSGGLLGPSIEAADLLAEKLGSENKIALVNANWVKPLDEDMLAQIVDRKVKLLVTLEDHYATGGLGGAVSERLAAWGASTRLLQIGVEGFGQSGTPEANYEAYGFKPEAIAKRIALELASS